MAYIEVVEAVVRWILSSISHQCHLGFLGYIMHFTLDILQWVMYLVARFCAEQLTESYRRLLEDLEQKMRKQALLNVTRRYSSGFLARWCLLTIDFNNFVVHQ